jgi:hypothetical protein
MEIRQPSSDRITPRAVEGFFGEVDAHDLPWGEPFREAARDASRPAAHVEKPHARSEMRQQERRGLVGGALSVLA